mmetsp:Transcript_51832/g.82350  ORF Transcript_51832/g.82350 Transcript_51832/m.82350 type:complete len:168 (+) Transcript_51832:54-557(+)
MKLSYTPLVRTRPIQKNSLIKSPLARHVLESLTIQKQGHKRATPQLAGMPHSVPPPLLELKKHFPPDAHGPSQYFESILADSKWVHLWPEAAKALLTSSSVNKFRYAASSHSRCLPAQILMQFWGQKPSVGTIHEIGSDVLLLRGRLDPELLRTHCLSPPMSTISQP